MNEVVTLGIDLAKNVFAVHGVDVTGRVVLRRMVTRAKLPELVARLPRCRIGMEACGVPMNGRGGSCTLAMT